jgi:hypothetical protein
LRIAKRKREKDGDALRIEEVAKADEQATEAEAPQNSIKTQSREGKKLQHRINKVYLH